MAFNYREMKSADLHLCALLFQKGFSQEPWNEDWTYEQANERLDALISAKNGLGYVVFDQDCLVGMLLGRQLIYMDKKQLCIDEFCIHQDYQGAHLGTQLLDYAKCECQKRQIHQMVLNTVRGFLSDGFYRKNGFWEVESLVCMCCDF